MPEKNQPESLRIDKHLQHQTEDGFAGFVLFLTIASGLAFIVWFYWALVMRFASF